MFIENRNSHIKLYVKRYNLIDIKKHKRFKLNELKFSEEELIVSKTDTKGRVTYGNELFLKLSGYEENHILGAPHNIIRHPEMPKIIFKLLWNTLKTGKEIYAYVLNRSKNGDYYWVNYKESKSKAGPFKTMDDARTAFANDDLDRYRKKR